MSNTKLIQYTHRPNTTELGMGNTHETYMLINSDIDLSGIFPPSQEVKVRDVASGKHYILKSATGREFRVNQMGELYRDYNILPGDEIVITKIEKGDEFDTCVNVRQYNRVVLIIGSNGTEVVNIDRLNDYSVANRSFKISISDRGNLNSLTISFKESKRKRTDSPNFTDYYYAKINGQILANGTYYLTLGNSSSLAMLPKSEYNVVGFNENLLNSLSRPNNKATECLEINSIYRPYITAIKSKPFLLLAGISGTGKSRIVRELARACWDRNSKEYQDPKPRNFEIVQVKPNWHDSSELIGYVSRVSGQAEYVAGSFLRFITKAWAEKDVPFFLCLDEMNLAPVEQYFAEYLSVVESRKNIDGIVVTDPIVPAAKMKGPSGVLIPNIWYSRLVDELLSDSPSDKEQELRNQFNDEGICLPPNLIVIGTVNMDETTFSFSRKVLDRAMTIEMNEVNLKGGLTERYEQIGKLGAAELIGTAVEGVDVYKTYQTVCDKVIDDLDTINKELNSTPFKIAYRTRNEFLLYVVNNLPYMKEKETEDYVIRRALDEIISMKILSRIEGDSDRIGNLLERLTKVIKDILGDSFSEDNSVSLKKLAEMENRLKSGYTSFWS